jgi:hypothetical protein
MLGQIMIQHPFSAKLAAVTDLPETTCWDRADASAVPQAS